MQKVDIIDVMERLRNIVEKTNKLAPSTIEIGERVLENRIIVLEGYLNFLEQAAIPSMRLIAEELDNLGERVYIGGKKND